MHLDLDLDLDVDLDVDIDDCPRGKRSQLCGY